MIIVDELKEGFNIMVHPKSATQKKRKIGEALLFYYKVSIVPLILYIIFALVVPPTSINLITGTVSSSMLVLWGLLFIFILTPIGFFLLRSSTTYLESFSRYFATLTQTPLQQQSME